MEPVHIVDKRILVTKGFLRIRMSGGKLDCMHLLMRYPASSHPSLMNMLITGVVIAGLTLVFSAVVTGTDE